MEQNTKVEKRNTLSYYGLGNPVKQDILSWPGIPWLQYILIFFDLNGPPPPGNESKTVHGHHGCRIGQEW